MVDKSWVYLKKFIFDWPKSFVYRLDKFLMEPRIAEWDVVVQNGRIQNSKFIELNFWVWFCFFFLIKCQILKYRIFEKKVSLVSWVDCMSWRITMMCCVFYQKLRQPRKRRKPPLSRMQYWCWRSRSPLHRVCLVWIRRREIQQITMIIFIFCFLHVFRNEISDSLCGKNHFRHGAVPENNQDKSAQKFGQKFPHIIILEEWHVSDSRFDPAFLAFKLKCRTAQLVLRNQQSAFWKQKENPPINQSTDGSIQQSINQPIDQWTNQSINDATQF